MSRSGRSWKASGVVSGAGSGIGRAFALEIAARGGSVVCADINGASAKATAVLIADAGGTAFDVECDVADLDAVEHLADVAECSLKAPVSLVINNAGIGTGGKNVGDTPYADWRKTVDVNLWGVINGCHVFTPRLRATGRGGIINVASAASFAAAPRMAPYCVTKAGVLALSETMAAELAGSGVAISVLCPTFVKTSIIENGVISDDAVGVAAKLMQYTGVSPESIVRTTLNAHDKGHLYVVPQLDAKAIWAAKRLLPGTYTYGLGLVSRVVSRLQED